MANGKPNAGLMDIPSQLDPEDIAAEIELEIPGGSNYTIAELQDDEFGAIETGKMLIQTV